MEGVVVTLPDRLLVVRGMILALLDRIEDLLVDMMIEMIVVGVMIGVTAMTVVETVMIGTVLPLVEGKCVSFSTPPWVVFVFPLLSLLTTSTNVHEK